MRTDKSDLIGKSWIDDRGLRITVVGKGVFYPATCLVCASDLGESSEIEERKLRAIIEKAGKGGK